ncbi:hypothetical protein FGO68_gene6584 [Halteria grandinella]|uniref:Uncharacterized protein n=1 Tax=Halteria grandinella TaxID=5974 RepID=A0A8J8NC81_HALGN|nr:hypothetical protein FGO68_gene6584 [Halteria grandinella]
MRQPSGNISRSIDILEIFKYYWSKLYKELKHSMYFDMSTQTQSQCHDKALNSNNNGLRSLSNMRSLLKNGTISGYLVIIIRAHFK